MALKDDILRLLFESRDADLSGQALAERFGVSRNAVWKAVNALKQEGYDILSTTNRGYRLSETCDRLSVGLLSGLLGDKTLPVYVLSAVDSTNSEAKRRLSAGAEGRFLVAAEQQTGGRGRLGRAFFSPPGAGLYMTLALSPGDRAENVVGVTAFAAVAAAEAISELCSLEVGIKWVNDLYLDGKKVCGILTEAISDFESGMVKNLIIGIGINLHPYELSEELRDIVGFLDCGPVKNRLAAGVAARLLKYDPNDKSYLDAYRRRSVVLGKNIVYYKNGAAFYGSAVGIDEGGGLIVKAASGETETLRSGEITVRTI